MKIELDLDLDAHLANHIGYDEDGNPVQQRTTLEDVVLGMVAQRLQQTIVADDAKTWLRHRVEAVRDEEIREQIRPLVAEALTRALQPTDHYGNPKGAPTTLAELVTKEAAAALQNPRDTGYSKPKATLVQQIIQAEVDTAFRKELVAAIDEGKRTVVAALREEGARVLSETIKRAADR